MAALRDISVDALLGQLDDAITGCALPVAFAFDADGTLWSGDAGEDFLFALIARKLVQAEAAEALERQARAHGISVSGLSPPEMVKTLFDAYVAGRYPEDDICRVTSWACAGYTEATVSDLAHGILVDAKLPSRVLPETAKIAAFANEKGIPIYVVSASPIHVVKAGVKLIGFTCEKVVAAAPQYAMGRMLARTVEPIPYGEGKPALLTAELRAKATANGRPLHTLLAAFGDNVFDLPMLSAATFGVVIRPKKRLLDALRPDQAERLWHLLPAEAGRG